jgi:hypothetical protein
MYLYYSLCFIKHVNYRNVSRYILMLDKYICISDIFYEMKEVLFNGS